jgi:hypothetical protein
MEEVKKREGWGGDLGRQTDGQTDRLERQMDR